MKTHFVVSKFFSRKSCRLWENVEKYCTRRARQATDDSMARALWMLDPKGYKYTHWGCV